MSHPFILELVKRNSVIPLLKPERVGDALPLVEAFQEGGLAAFEVSLSSKNGADILQCLKDHCSDVAFGASGVRNVEDVKRAKALGAMYVSSPGFSPTVVQACSKLKLPLIPGVSTTSELLMAREIGFTVMHVYPAHLSDSQTLARAWSELMPEVRLYPTGGLTEALALEWLAHTNVCTVSGSWLACADDIHRRLWRNIIEAAHRAAALKTRIRDRQQAA
jgi:2-dehydro-3-deoxyphosphogluconate aldolase/(4S)-4-hydroxy-2-oxoglutarate aldolase